MVFYEHPHFRMSRKLLLVVGQWPYDERNTKYLLRAVLSILPIITCVTETYEIVSCNVKFDRFIRTLPYITFAMIYALKYFSCWIKLGDIKNILIRIRLDWDALRSENEIEIMKSCTADGWILGKAYVLIVFTATIGFVFLSFTPTILDIIRPLNVSRTEELLSHAGYLTNSHGYSFYILMNFQCAAVAGVTTMTASDLYYIMVLYHGCGLYGIAGYRSQHLFDDLQLISNRHKEAVLRRRIADVVTYHMRIIEYVDLLMSCYTVAYAMQFFVAVVAVAGLLLNVQEWLLVGDHVLAIAFIFELFGYYFIMFLDVAPGQRLRDQSSELFHKLYNANWYKAPLKTQKLMLFMLQKVQEPSILSAVGILDMTYNSWVTILQTSLSYFMVISSVRK